MSLALSHFSAALVFSFFVSIVFGITQKSTKPEMIRYGIKCFIFFAVGTILAGWAMYGLRIFAIRP